MEQINYEKVPEWLKCEVCEKAGSDVKERPNEFARQISGETDAVHTACDECDEQNKLAI